MFLSIPNLLLFFKCVVLAVVAAIAHRTMTLSVATVTPQIYPLENHFSLFKFKFILFFYPPAVAKVGFRLADLPARHAQVVLEVVVEVPAEAAGVLLVGARHAHLQVRSSAPQNLVVATSV